MNHLGSSSSGGLCFGSTGTTSLNIGIKYAIRNHIAGVLSPPTYCLRIDKLEKTLPGKPNFMFKWTFDCNQEDSQMYLEILPPSNDDPTQCGDILISGEIIINTFYHTESTISCFKER
jgi:hypothetical protein